MTLAEALRTAAFWKIAIGFFFVAGVVAALIISPRAAADRQGTGPRRRRRDRKFHGHCGAKAAASA